MTLIDQLKVQVQRVRTYRERKQNEGIDAAASGAAQEALAVLGWWERFSKLDELPLRLFTDIEEADTAIGAVEDALRGWTEGVTKLPTVEAVSGLQGLLSDARVAIATTYRAGETEARRQLKVHRTGLKNAEFLAQALSGGKPETKQIQEARTAFREAIDSVENVVEGRSADAAAVGSWASRVKRYEAVASARACLRRAKLSEMVGDVVGKLLEEDTVGLESVSQEALSELINVPELSRLCRLSLVKEGA